MSEFCLGTIFPFYRSLNTRSVYAAPKDDVRIGKGFEDTNGIFNGAGVIGKLVPDGLDLELLSRNGRIQNRCHKKIRPEFFLKKLLGDKAVDYVIQHISI